MRRGPRRIATRRTVTRPTARHMSRARPKPLKVEPIITALNNELRSGSVIYTKQDIQEIVNKMVDDVIDRIPQYLKLDNRFKALSRTMIENEVKRCANSWQSNNPESSSIRELYKFVIGCYNVWYYGVFIKPIIPENLSNNLEAEGGEQINNAMIKCFYENNPTGCPENLGRLFGWYQRRELIFGSDVTLFSQIKLTKMWDLIASTNSYRMLNFSALIVYPIILANFNTTERKLELDQVKFSKVTFEGGLVNFAQLINQSQNFFNKILIKNTKFEGILRVYPLNYETDINRTIFRALDLYVDTIGVVSKDDYYVRRNQQKREKYAPGLSPTQELGCFIKNQQQCETAPQCKWRKSATSMRNIIQDLVERKYPQALQQYERNNPQGGACGWGTLVRDFKPAADYDTLSMISETQSQWSNFKVLYKAELIVPDHYGWVMEGQNEIYFMFSPLGGPKGGTISVILGLFKTFTNLIFNAKVKKDTIGNLTVGFQSGFYSVASDWFEKLMFPEKRKEGFFRRIPATEEGRLQIRAHIIETMKRKNVICTGISMGGALANICSFLLMKYTLEILRQQKPKITVLAYGAPVIANDAFKTFFIQYLSKISLNIYLFRILKYKGTMRIQFDPFAKSRMGPGMAKHNPSMRVVNNRMILINGWQEDMELQPEYRPEVDMKVLRYFYPTKKDIPVTPANNNFAWDQMHPVGAYMAMMTRTNSSVVELDTGIFFNLFDKHYEQEIDTIKQVWKLSPIALSKASKAYQQTGNDRIRKNLINYIITLRPLLRLPLERVEEARKQLVSFFPSELAEAYGYISKNIKDSQEFKEKLSRYISKVDLMVKPA